MDTTSGARMRIGKVVELLSDEFPDISISKLRFLEDRGLVEPHRTPGGYRMYSERNVRELRHVLAMQRDEFLPLKVIREELRRRIDDGSGSSDTPASTAPAPVRRRAAGAAARVSLTASESEYDATQVAKARGVDGAFIDQCREWDLITGRRTSDGRLMLSEQEAEIVTAAARLSRLGVDLRILRPVRAAAGRQAGLVEQFAAGRLRSASEDTRTRGLRQVEELTQSIADLAWHAFIRDVRLMTARAVGIADAEQARPAAHGDAATSPSQAAARGGSTTAPAPPKSPAAAAAARTRTATTAPLPHLVADALAAHETTNGANAES